MSSQNEQQITNKLVPCWNISKQHHVLSSSAFRHALHDNWLLGPSLVLRDADVGSTVGPNRPLSLWLAILSPGKRRKPKDDLMQAQCRTRHLRCAFPTGNMQAECSPCSPNEASKRKPTPSSAKSRLRTLPSLEALYTASAPPASQNLAAAPHGRYIHETWTVVRFL